ncbi:Eco57I restriction-modification methylase domain-containing protein, partial [Flavobacterium cucumis]
MLLEPRKALNKAFLKIKPNRTGIELFKQNLILLLDSIKDKESEEFHKNLISDFLKNTYYSPNHFINTKGRNDLVIHIGKEAKSNVGVIIEAKSPTNKAEMLSQKNINSKALQEMVLYFLRERITHKNLEVKNVVATNVNEWYIFDAQLFDKLFAQNKSLVKQFQDFEEGKLSGTNTDFFYKEIAKPYIETVLDKLEYTYFDLASYDKILRNEDKLDDAKLIVLYKLLSPEHLLKLSFANDSNSLDKNFYNELLHLIGLTETKEGGKKLIERPKVGQRNAGSLLENVINQLDSLDKLSRLPNVKQYGDTHEERLFTVGLELCITWVNRILFLKLLEAQLISYHKGDKSYAFLHKDLLHDYDNLNALFFMVLAKKPEERNDRVKSLFAKVPYLNSSLFEPTELEHQTLFISGLEDDIQLPIVSGTVLKDANGKKLTGTHKAIEYFFDFLDAYDFASEGSEEIQEDNKTLINASVLGLIFEKINGYKDGSFYTPSFITMYMCKETIRRAVVQKFNETKGWNCEDFDALYNKIEDTKEANAIINSVKICDPAVGSGHFLVSALNEMIAIKHDLKVLVDREGKRLKEYQVDIVNDELIVTDEDGLPFTYNPKSKESQRVQETLFHEKQTIIENCLFGVDINPNSVKICRLRLWIELLKNSYYQVEVPPSGVRGLETLPNIDINIKCGNSLIARFGLDADLKEALKKSNKTIADYKNAVKTYHNASSKEEKKAMEDFILSVKQNFSSEIRLNDPLRTKLQKLSSELYHRFTGTFLFEPETPYGKSEKDLEKKRKAEKEKLEKEIDKIEKHFEEVKSNKIYENAFEWRFEFPEVLNDDGDFVGFDVVIGNPPYGVSLSENEIDYYRKKYSLIIGHSEVYYMFIELGLNRILRKNQILSFIIPNAWLSNKYAKALRESLIKDYNLLEIINFNQKIIFEDAQVETCIVTVNKSHSNKLLNVGQSIDDKYEFNSEVWLENENRVINFSENFKLQELLLKISSTKTKIS